jgi:hypothetical protein
MSTPWNPNYIRKSKTKTSSQVKARYNRKNYDQITIRAGKGSLQAVHLMAELRGMSVAAYIRHLIIKDCEEAAKPELSAILGGGGDLITLAQLLDMDARELQRDLQHIGQ